MSHTRSVKRDRSDSGNRSVAAKRARETPTDDLPDAIVVPVGETLRERIERLSDPVVKHVDGRVRTIARFWSWLKRLKPYRVYINFSYNDGNLRSAGMSYQSLFASFAGIWVGFSIAGIWLKSAPKVQAELIDIINTAIPGLISQSGLIKPDALPSSFTFGWTGVIAIVGLLWTAVAWLFYTRQAVRAMFGLQRDTTNYALQKVRDLGLAFCFGLLLLVSAIVSVVSSAALTFILDLFGLSDNTMLTQVAIRTVGFVIALALNFVVLATMYRLLSRIRIPWRNLLFGSFLGGAALSAVSVAGSLIVGAAANNPLLASVAVFIGLLVWFLLICRIMLLSASWIAVGMADAKISARTLSPEQAAAETAAAERAARLLVARSDVAVAEADMRSAGWFGKFNAQLKLDRARRRLDQLLDEGVGGDH